MNLPLLSLNQIKLIVPELPNPILNNLSLDILPGEFIILLGSNGSGKSSLLKIINGLAIPNSGTLNFCHKNLLADSLSSRASSIVTLTQDLNLSTFSNLTVLENCLIALHRNKRISLLISEKDQRKKILDHLIKFNPKFLHQIDKRAGLLSGGERQTLAFAMSLFSTPKLLLLDEHTSALDPFMAEKLMELTHERVLEQRITTLMTTHNLDDALKYGNRLIVMRHGQIILDIKDAEKDRLTKRALRDLYS